MRKYAGNKASAEMGINRQKPERQVQEAKVRAEQRGCRKRETTKSVIRMSGLKSSQSGEVGMKQSRVDQKKREKVRMKTANKMENRRVNDDRRAEAGEKNYRV